jgi:hypothetical protein
VEPAAAQLEPLCSFMYSFNKHFLSGLSDLSRGREPVQRPRGQGSSREEERLDDGGEGWVGVTQSRPHRDLDTVGWGGGSRGLWCWRETDPDEGLNLHFTERDE